MVVEVRATFASHLLLDNGSNLLGGIGVTDEEETLVGLDLIRPVHLDSFFKVGLGLAGHDDGVSVFVPDPGVPDVRVGGEFLGEHVAAIFDVVAAHDVLQLVVVPVEVVPFEVDLLGDQERAPDVVWIFISDQSVQEESEGVFTDFDPIVESTSHEGVLNSQVLLAGSLGDVGLVGQLPLFKEVHNVVGGGLAVRSHFFNLKQELDIVLVISLVPVCRLLALGGSLFESLTDRCPVLCAKSQDDRVVLAWGIGAVEPIGMLVDRLELSEELFLEWGSGEHGNIVGGIGSIGESFLGKLKSLLIRPIILSEIHLGFPCFGLNLGGIGLFGLPFGADILCFVSISWPRHVDTLYYYGRRPNGLI